jgi:hypothetical protein
MTLSELQQCALEMDCLEELKTFSGKLPCLGVPESVNITSTSDVFVWPFSGGVQSRQLAFLGEKLVHVCFDRTLESAILSGLCRFRLRVPNVFQTQIPFISNGFGCHVTLGVSSARHLLAATPRHCV